MTFRTIEPSLTTGSPYGYLQEGVHEHQINTIMLEPVPEHLKCAYTSATTFYPGSKKLRLCYLDLVVLVQNDVKYKR